MLTKLKNFLCYALVLAVALPGAAMLGLIAPQKAHAQTPGEIVINEFVSAGTSDWVELYNPTSSQVDISGWILKDSIDTHEYVFPADTYINANSYVTIDFNYLNGDEDTIRLFDNSNTPVLIDSVNYGNSEDAIVSAPQTGYSAGRFADGTDNWYSDLYPTKNAANIRDVTAPYSAIANPIDSESYKTLNPIIGTSMDTESGIKEVKIEIKNITTGQYFNGTAWQNTSIWLLTVGTASWMYNLDNTYLATNNEYAIAIKAIDNAGNEQTALSGACFTYDTTAPTGTLAINNGATITNSQTVNLKFSSLSADTKTLIVSNNEDLSNPTQYDNPGAEKEITDWALSDNNGNKTVYAKLIDQAGNESNLISATIQYNASANVAETYPIVANTNAQQINSTNNPELELSFVAQQDTVFTIDTYNSDPSNGKSLPYLVSPFGKYYEISLSSDFASTINGDVHIRIYYTQDDLKNANITEDQLTGLYFYNSAAWDNYESGVNKDDVMISGIQYAGFIWANANHFTPMVVGYDTPTKPANFAVESQNGSVKLTWDKVDNAEYYVIRYREATSVDDTDYQYVYEMSKNITSTTINNLKNGVIYEFGIATMSEYAYEHKTGTLSQYAVVIGSPRAPYTYGYSLTSAVSQDQVSQNSNQNSTDGSDEQTVTVEGGQVKSEQTANNNRLWTIIGIILIVAGAAYAGYYGYEWWMEKPQKATVKNKTPKTPKSPKDAPKTGRW